MTLLVDSNAISIRNSAGTTKFTSDNKLVYQRAYQTGSITCTSSTVYVPFTTLTDNEFLVISIKISSGTGQSDLLGVILNKEIPANGGVMVDFFGRNVNNQAAADSEILGVDSFGNSLLFKTVRYTNYGRVIDGTTTVNLTYYARVWSYL